MYKERILITATNLFTHYGIKGVSMSQIAGALHISKKTLYEVFESKEVLLSACLDYEKNRMTMVLNKTENEAHNALETLLLATVDVYRYRSNFCPSFMKDIKRFPELHHKILLAKELLYGRYIQYFHKGVEQGYFIPDSEYDRLTELIIEQINDLKNTLQQPYLMITFLRGVCTDKGIDTLSNFIPINIHSYQ